MFTLKQTKTVPLTRDFAEHFASLPTLKGDRPKDTAAGKRRIKWLKRLVQEGKFYSPKWSTAELHGTTYRINGGHSSMMLTGLNGQFPRGLVAVVDEFQCETDHDLVDLFDQFDTRNSVRQSTDVVRAHKSIHASLDGVSTMSINRTLGGIKFYYTDAGVKMDSERRVRLIHSDEHERFMLWADSLYSGKHMRNSGVIAAMFATYQKDPQKSDVFWNEVLRESNPDPDNASRVISRFLRENVGRKQSSGKDKWTTHAIYVKCIHAWNAWRRGEGTSLKYHVAAGTPRLF